MRIVFMGTPAIAAVCLQKLVEAGHEIAGVFTKPDTPKNRGMKMMASEVKQYALQAGLPVYQPVTFRDGSAAETLRALQPELIAVVAYGKILPQQVLDIPPLGCVNIHASILPALRGAAPIQRAVLDGLEETGVTAMYMDAGMDTGDILAISRTPIAPLETSGELTDRLAVLGADLLCRTLEEIAAGRAVRTPQDPAGASYAPMLSRADSPIDWARTRRQIVDQVRGLNPWPVATTELNGTVFKIYQAQPLDASGSAALQAPPGTPVALGKQGLDVTCGDGLVRITRLQAPGGKQMAAADYFRGHPIKPG